MKKNNKNCNIITTEGTFDVPSVVMRKCQGCGKIQDRNKMIRILSDCRNGTIIIEPSSKQFGRSLYICKDSECLKNALKRKRLKHLSEEQTEYLRKLISEKI